MWKITIEKETETDLRMTFQIKIFISHTILIKKKFTDDVLIYSSFFSLKQLKSYGLEDHDSVTPHLLHSINVSQIDMEFVNLSWNSSIASPRIAAEFALVASESPKKPYKITKRKTVDDEHTPGIFTLVDVISPEGGNDNGTQGKFD